MPTILIVYCGIKDSDGAVINLRFNNVYLVRQLLYSNVDGDALQLLST